MVSPFSDKPVEAEGGSEPCLGKPWRLAVSLLCCLGGAAEVRLQTGGGGPLRVELLEVGSIPAWLRLRAGLHLWPLSLSNT